MRINTNKRRNINASNPEHVKINLDLSTYSILCKYVLQSPNFVRMEHLVNLRRLINVIDRSSYENNPDIVRRVDFINKALEARLIYNLSDIDIILTHINGGLTYQVDFLDYNNLTMSSSEILWCHNLVTETLKYSFIDYNLIHMQDIITRYKTTDYGNRGSIVQEFEDTIDSLKNGFRKVKTETNINDVTFSLQDGQFESAITDTYNIVTSPSRRLVTGMVGLNEMIGGGFESGRVYMFLGTSGVGKSVTLLNLLYQLKIYNNRYQLKDPTKIPCVVMLTMENTVVETLTRLFDMVIENSHGMNNYQLDDVIHLLRTEGNLRVNESSPIDIVIQYRANKSVDTSYYYTLYDNLEDQGYEPICIVQDHIKRIRSVENNPDLRIELGDVVNETKVFAAEKQIPVITVSHLNRDATKVLEEALRKGDKETGKLLGKSNIGESLLMIDNIDCAMVLAKDYDKDGKCWMTFNRIKMRDRGSKREYICQPFIYGNEIRLEEDYYAIAPVFKESIHSEVFNNGADDPVVITGAKSLTNGNMYIDDTDNDDNSFTIKEITNNITENENKLSVTEGNNINIEASNIFNQINNITGNAFIDGLDSIEYKEPIIPVIFRPFCPVTFDN